MATCWRCTVWGGRSEQIGQGKLTGGDPGGQRYHGLAAWLHQGRQVLSWPRVWPGGWLRNLPQQGPSFPYYRELSFLHAPLHRQSQFPSHITLAVCSAQRILRKQDLLNFMSSLTAAVPSHWGYLGCWQQATQPLKGHPSDFYQVRQYFPHQGTWHLLGRCSRTDAPGEAMCRAHIRHWSRRAAPWEASPACFWFFPDHSSHPPAPSLGCTVLPGGRRRNCCLAPGLPFVQ